ncbi:hypothetical protein GCM10027265_21460 [Jatrophihabitans fulvus]
MLVARRPERATRSRVIGAAGVTTKDGAAAVVRDLGADGAVRAAPGVAALAATPMRSIDARHATERMTVSARKNLRRKCTVAAHPHFSASVTLLVRIWKPGSCNLCDNHP